MTVIDILGKEMVNKISDRLLYLKCRWTDEKKYEDFEDYRQNITSLLLKVKEVKIISLDKKFTLIFEVNEAKIIFKIVKGGVSYGQFPKRVKEPQEIVGHILFV